MDEPGKANDRESSGALFSGIAGDTMQQVVLCFIWCALGALSNPSTHTEGHVTVLIRVLESRLRGNSPERFGRGERAQAPTYPYKRADVSQYLAGGLLHKNLRESLEGLLARHLAAEYKQQTQATLDEQEAPMWQPKRAVKISPALERLQQSRREERLARYEQVIALCKLGLSQAAIARQASLWGNNSTIVHYSLLVPQRPSIMVLSSYSIREGTPRCSQQWET